MSTDKKDYSFILPAGKKTRYVAGPYDTETRMPRYEISISAPLHVRDLVEVNPIMLGSPDDCRLGWDIHNKSSWRIYVTITKDGDIVINA